MKNTDEEVQDVINELEPMKDIDKPLKIKVTLTPEYHDLVKKIDELSSLLDSFFEIPERFIKTS